MQIPAVRISDPLHTEPLSLSLAALEHLVAAGLFHPNPNSPFAFLQDAAPHTSDDEREAARRALDERGLTLGGAKGWVAGRPHPSPEATMFDESLAILAAPAASLQLTLAEPPGAPTVMPIFLGDGQAVFAGIDDGAFLVAAPVKLGALLSGIAREVAAQTDSDQLTVWPSELRFATLVWQGAGRRAVEPVPRPQARQALSEAGVAPDQAEFVLDRLLADGVLDDTEAGLALLPPFSYWFDLIWSGHELELAVVSFGAAAASGDAPAARRLLFVGPPGARAAVERLRGEELAQALGVDEHGEPVPALEDEILVLSHLPPEAAERALGNLLGLPRDL